MHDSFEMFCFVLFYFRFVNQLRPDLRLFTRGIIYHKIKTRSEAQSHIIFVHTDCHSASPRTIFYCDCHSQNARQKLSISHCTRDKWRQETTNEHYCYKFDGTSRFTIKHLQFKVSFSFFLFFPLAFCFIQY